ncbi:MAG: Asp-tRNA(Asn)/Glu-tRNA(Gln) amidotransferase subunit GatA [Parcubacteria group bacterium]|nr:Asp-tRNA(Asn)/Glu-tRNA(Gln) amidotransferase subunit GatA [Parcubacteria group bacterium]MCR4342744.1 Asp-tRNA(Asn)/Glu-tRNA(Gln) amidotransferase subunit GatA [Patescibacteria group bacterium]
MDKEFFKNLTIKKATEAIKNGDITALELTQYYLNNIKEKNGEINAYLRVFADAEDQARKIDEDIKSGKEMGPLAGVPLAIKDNMLIKGKVASASSKILEDYKATYDATVITKLREAGAVFLGTVNMDEFAMGSSTENSAFGPTKNPHDPTRVPGGSSGGSAAAVAADMALASLGSDTGGSIRQPASFCGGVGLKPTYGRVSRSGLIAMASSLDQIGPIAKTTEDAEIIFNIIKGEDTLDATTSLGHAVSKSEAGGKKLKIGVLGYDKNGVAPEINTMIESSIEVFKKNGHEITEVTLPYLKYSLPCYYIIMPAEVSSNLARLDGVKYGLLEEGDNLLDDYLKTRGAGFGKETKRRIMIGTYVLSSGYYDAYYSKAQEVRNLIRKDFENAFDPSQDGVDAIILPTTTEPAFKLGEKTDDPMKMYLEDIFTVSANLAGVPAISIPAGHAERDSVRLPLGLQIIAPHFREDILFTLGKQVENANLANRD